MSNQTPSADVPQESSPEPATVPLREAGTASSGVTSSGSSGGSGPRRGLLIGLLALIAALLLSVVVLLVMLLSGGGSAAPEPEPSPEPTAEPVPAVIVDFGAESTVAQCSNDNAGTTVTVTLHWSVTDATEIAIASAGVGLDAIEEPTSTGLPAEATGYEMPYPCEEATWFYSLTVLGEEGDRSTSTVNVNRELPAPPPLPVFTNASWSDGLDYAICPSFDNGSTVSKTITWSASGPGTVSLYYAAADDYYPGGSANYTRFAQGLPLSGTHSVNINCGTSGYSSFFTVRVVVSNETGADVRLVSGNTAS